jgi:hypothetical protein
MTVKIFSTGAAMTRLVMISYRMPAMTPSVHSICKPFLSTPVGRPLMFSQM